MIHPRTPRRHPGPGKALFRSAARYLWAMLLARLYEVFPLTCPICGGEMRVIAFITEASPVQRILAHIDEPVQPPAVAPARGPLGWDDAAEPLPDWEAMAQPESEYPFD